MQEGGAQEFRLQDNRLMAMADKVIKVVSGKVANRLPRKWRMRLTEEDLAEPEFVYSKSVHEKGGRSDAANRLLDSLVRAAADDFNLSRGEIERLRTVLWKELIPIVRKYWRGELSPCEAIGAVKKLIAEVTAGRL